MTLFLCGLCSIGLCANITFVPTPPPINNNTNNTPAHHTQPKWGYVCIDTVSGLINIPVTIAAFQRMQKASYIPCYRKLLAPITFSASYVVRGLAISSELTAAQRTNTTSANLDLAADTIGLFTNLMATSTYLEAFYSVYNIYKSTEAKSFTLEFKKLMLPRQLSKKTVIIGIGTGLAANAVATAMSVSGIICRFRCIHWLDRITLWSIMFSAISSITSLTCLKAFLDHRQASEPLNP